MPSVAPDPGFHDAIAGRGSVRHGAVRFLITLLRSGNSLPVWLRRCAPAVLLAFGLWLCLRLVLPLDRHAVLEDCRRAGPGLLLVFLAPAVGNFIHMLGWQALIARELRPTRWRAFRIFVAAQAGNDLGLGVLGESIKITAFPGERRTAAGKAVVLDNLTSLVALFVVVLSVGGLLGAQALRGVRHHVISLAALAVLLLAAGCAFALSRWRSALREKVSTLLFAFAAHYFGKLWIVAEMGLALALLGVASAPASALLGLAAALGSAVGAPVPGQLGVVETALVSSAAIAHISVAHVVSVALLRRMRGLLWMLIGVLFFVELTARGRAVGVIPSTRR